MANIYTWSVDSLDCSPSQDGQTNIVSVVHWRVNATNGQTATITKPDNTQATIIPIETTTYGVQPLTYTAGTPFIPYAGLTQATVIEWAQSAMGAAQVAAIQTKLDNQIANLVNPPIVTPNLPWSN